MDTLLSSGKKTPPETIENIQAILICFDIEYK